jgi:hypothetical protein
VHLSSLEFDYPASVSFFKVQYQQPSWRCWYSICFPGLNVGASLQVCDSNKIATATDSPLPRSPKKKPQGVSPFEELGSNHRDSAVIRDFVEVVVAGTVRRPEPASRR